MGAGIPYFVLEEGRFHALGLILRFRERQPLGLWELCIWTIRFSQNSGWQIGIEHPPPPLQDIVKVWLVAPYMEPARKVIKFHYT